MTATDDKVLALAQHLGVKPSKISDGANGWYEVKDTTDEYMVLTDREADEAWDEELENYIDDCILPELNEAYSGYFDREAWKRDARYDGRGHALNHYDGTEYEEQVNNTWYYIYQIN